MRFSLRKKSNRPSAIIILTLVALLVSTYYFWQKDIDRLADNREAELEKVSGEYYEGDTLYFDDGSLYNLSLPDDSSFDDSNLGL